MILFSSLSELMFFRNNHAKREYPARGSIICHWATEHGKVIEAMKADKEVDMSQVLSLLKSQDERMRGFIERGTKTGCDRNPVKILKSLNGGNLNANSQQQRILIKCPKCSKLDKNRCKNSLKLHLFHHYLDFWKEKVPQIESKSTICEQCTPHKKIVGANAEGLRMAVICHRAIQHSELREALREDTSLPGELINILYSDTAQAKVLEVKPVTQNNIQSSLDVTSERERILQEVRKRELHMSIEAGEQLRSKKHKIPGDPS